MSVWFNVVVASAAIHGDSRDVPASQPILFWEVPTFPLSTGSPLRKRLLRKEPESLHRNGAYSGIGRRLCGRMFVRQIALIDGDVFAGPNDSLTGATR